MLAQALGRPPHLIPGGPSFDLARARVEKRAVAAVGEPVADVADVVVGGVGCRLFRPEQPDAPVLLYLHGGGWTFGSIQEAEPLCRALVNRAGWAVLAVDYRLAPEHPFPAAVEDAEAVFAGLPQCGGQLGVDVSRVAMAGDSAGANLGVSMALRARDRGSPPFLYQALLYPVLDLVSEAPSRIEFGTGYGIDREAVRWHADSYVPDPADRRRADVSPLWAGSLAGLPPTLVVTAEFDPLRDEGEAYAARLAETGVPVVATRYLGVVHGFADPAAFDAADAVLDQVGGALRRIAGR